jgi:pSer/pThr/pTyr-binding forkhead associated (FHA) protein
MESQVGSRRPATTMISSQDQMDVDLLVIYSRNAELLGRRYSLGPSPAVVTVGRQPQNTIVFHSDSVSRRHARFEKRADGWWVIDGTSTCGTFVNDELVQEALLRHRDKVRIGDTILKVLRSGEVDGIVESI